MGALDVLGDGPEREKLERQAAALGIEDKITFHGYSEETDRLYGKFVMSSVSVIYSEGMPLTLGKGSANRDSR
ncbi:MAG: glycosyltransferase [Synergistaceae bacterium]